MTEETLLRTALEESLRSNGIKDEDQLQNIIDDFMETLEEAELNAEGLEEELEDDDLDEAPEDD